MKTAEARSTPSNVKDPGVIIITGPTPQDEPEERERERETKLLGPDSKPNN